MLPSPALSIFLTGVAAVLGACVGSFLNVVIYRLPREDCSIHKPTRSFCPSCKKPIPAYLNIPVLAWVFLGGKCKECKAAIGWRYPAVELLTAILFVWVWQTHHWQVSIALWIFVSLLVVATFIDVDHMIIPDSITLGGTAAGIIAAALVPPLMDVGNWYHAVGQSVFGAFVGYGILWAVISAGKLAFGKKTFAFEEERAWELSQPEGSAEPILQIEKEGNTPWTDIFCRDSDRLSFSDGKVALEGGEKRNYRELVFEFERFHIDGETVALESVEHIGGTARRIVMSREAMGYGDAKLEACIGAFLGWKAVPFSLFAGSLAGCLLWLLGKLFGRDARKLPFGPYLAFGALLWLFYGERLVAWYLSLLRPGF